MPRRLLAVLMAAAFLAPPAAAAGQTPLSRRLSRALAVPHVAKSRSAAFAVDLVTGQTVYARHPGLSLIPASNQKLAVTYASLLALGAPAAASAQPVATPLPVHRMSCRPTAPR